MALVEWPELLPLPAMGGLAIANGSASVRSTFANGRDRSRRLSHSPHSTVNATLNFSTYENAIFDGFFRHMINGGDDWFLMNLPVAFGLEPHTVKCIGSPSAGTRIDVDLIQRSIQLTIKRPAIIEADLLAILEIYGLQDLEQAAQILQGFNL